MSLTLRPATPDDIPKMVPLLMRDAQERHAQDGVLWAIADTATEQVEKALTLALSAAQQPVRQIWHVAQKADRIVGVVHAMMLPVPPIYAGAFGEPGLILPDVYVASDAPDGTIDALIEDVENALKACGAQILLSSYVCGEDWRLAFDRRGYAPLTLYLSRTGFGGVTRPDAVRPAVENDVPGIVARSAEHRQILCAIDPFWDIHPDADARFSAWMTRSLTLRDRDMMVLGPSNALDGYVIAQPASRLHFPAAHDISGIGVIDDYYHPEISAPHALENGGAHATALLRAAESAFADRRMQAAFVVCPAGWPSKIELLEAAGYKTAMVWSIKRLS